VLPDNVVKPMILFLFVGSQRLLQEAFPSTIRPNNAENVMRAEKGMPERIRIRVFSEEKKAIQAAAGRKGLSLSDYIRELAAQSSEMAA
jgi:predicted DNA binding CopG/RHH family protein